MPQDQSAADGSRLVSEFADDQEFSDLIELFVSELPDRLATIQGALGDADYVAIERLAHQLKGAAPGYGFPTIGEAAEHVEDWFQSLDTSPTSAQLSEIRRMIDALAEICRQATDAS